MPDHESAGRALREIRRSRKLSQETVAATINDLRAAGAIDKNTPGMSAPMLSRMEGGAYLSMETITAYLCAVVRLVPDAPLTPRERLEVWAGFHRCAPDRLPAHLGLGGDGDEVCA